MDEKVKITKDKLESWVLPESVPIWELHGWKEAKLTKDEEKLSEGAKTPFEDPALQEAKSEKK